MPKIGIGRGAHLLNAHSGGWTLQHVTNHFIPGQGFHDLEIFTEGGEFQTIKVHSKHQELMVSGPGALCYGYTNKAYFKKGENYERRYNSEERRNTWDDEEITHYEKTNSLCIQYDPSKCDPVGQEQTMALIWQHFNDKL